MSNVRLLARVTAVEPLEGFRLRLTFTDGLVREVDLSGDLWGPVAEPLQDPAYFRQVRVDPELGTVVWPNGYDLDPDVLHGDHEPVGRPAAHASRDPLEDARAQGTLEADEADRLAVQEVRAVRRARRRAA
jgi:Protein of unknown function (DUF2442)